MVRSCWISFVFCKIKEINPKMIDYVYVWVCDDPQCPYKGFDEYDADNHCVSKNHNVTKCKNCNYVDNEASN